jgi:hypothetical protein
VYPPHIHTVLALAIMASSGVVVKEYFLLLTIP